MEKRRNTEAIIIILLVVLLVAVTGFLAIRYFLKQNNDTINNDISNRNDIYNEQKENETNKVEKNQYNTVSDLIEDLVHKDNPIIKIVNNDLEYKLDMVLPYFKVKTETTEKINKEIYEIYKFYIEDYSSKEITQSSSRNTKISYKSGMDTTKGIITLEITIAYTDWAGTGEPNGSSTTIYKYDYLNDKLIEKKEQEKESVISTIIMYKRNSETNKYYEKKLTLSKEQIARIEGYIKNLTESQITNIGIDNYKLIIKYKAGTKTDLVIYKNGIVSYDNQKYKSTELEEYIKEIAYKTQWIDPYTNYKDVKWCEKKDEGIEIKNNQILITYGNTYSWTLKNDNPKSVAMYVAGGVPTFYVLGESGKVYNVDEDQNYKPVLNKKLSEYFIVAMTTEKTGVNYRPIYFLTSNGALIDFEGNTYEENNKELIGSYGYFSPIYFNKLGNVCYIDNKNRRVYIKDNKSQNIVAEIVFWQQLDDFVERYTILTNDNQVVYVTNDTDGKYNISYNNQKFKSYKFEKVIDENNDSQFNIVLSMEKNTNITISNIMNFYYNVKKNKQIEIVTVQDVIDNFKQTLQELDELSKALQNQINAAYDGKMITGTDVVSACQQYGNSNTMSVKVIVDHGVEYQGGKYEVKISPDVIKTLKQKIEGGVNVLPTDNGTYKTITENSLNEIKNITEINKQTYYSYLMKDTTSQTVLGILFVKKGAIK